MKTQPSKGFLLFELALAAYIKGGVYDTDYIDYDRADELTLQETAFPNFDALIDAPGGYRPSLDVSHDDRLELANTYDAAQARRGNPLRTFRYRNPSRRTTCQRPDSLIPQPVYNHDGTHAGMLMPRMRQDQIAASPGIQAWSAPTVETRTR